MRLSFRKIAPTIILSLVFVLALAGVAAAGPPWSDAPESYWAQYQVTAAEVATVADGYPDNTFKPGNPVTRGQFAKMAVSGLDLPTANPATATFADVAKGTTFFIYVEGAYDAQIIGGYPNGATLLFKPGNNITRQQTNSILGRYLSQAELTASGVIHGTVGNYGSLDLWFAAEGAFYLNAFYDANKVSVDHRATTAYLKYHGVVQGSNGYVNPTATLTRAQAAVMILRVAEEASDITSPPPAPTGLIVIPTSPGSDTTPQISGVAIANSPIGVYDTFNGATALVTTTSTNAAGLFYADITTPLVDGTHVFTAKTKNTNGIYSASSAPITYILDTVAPTGAITAPVVATGDPDAAVKLAKPVFTATAADERSGVKQVEFQAAVDTTTPLWQSAGVDEAPDTGTQTYTAPWTSALSAGLVDGQYLFRTIVTDNAGNTFTTATIKVTVDTTAPTAQIAAGSLVANLGGIFYTEDPKPIFGATSGDVTGGAVGTLPSGVTKIEFLSAPISPAPDGWEDFSVISSDAGASGFAVYSTAGMLDGHYLFAVRATDRAGNQSILGSGTPIVYAAGVTRQVVIDNAAPVVAVTAPTAGQEVPEAAPFNITWTLTDVSAPTTVLIEYSANGVEGWTTINATAPFTPGSTGSYSWTTPSVDADVATYKIRITAIDRTGTALGLTGPAEGHYTQVLSPAFTLKNATD